MPKKQQQIQWIREEIAQANEFAEQDRLAGFDDTYQRGKVAGLCKALSLIGGDK